MEKGNNSEIIEETIMVRDSYKTSKNQKLVSDFILGGQISIGAIYEGKGYMVNGHLFSKPHYFSDNVKLFLNDLEKDVKNENHLRIYLAGGNPDLEIERDNENWSRGIIQGRTKILKEITGSKFKERLRDVKWGKSYGQMQKLLVYPRKNKVELIGYSNLDDFLEEISFRYKLKR